MRRNIILSNGIICIVLVCMITGCDDSSGGGTAQYEAGSGQSAGRTAEFRDQDVRAAGMATFYEFIKLDLFSKTHTIASEHE